MPHRLIAQKNGENPDGRKNPGFRFDGSGKSFQSESVNRHVEGRKDGGDWFGAGEDCSLQRRAASRSPARKAASAKIAKIPFALSAWIARTYAPENPAPATPAPNAASENPSPKAL